MGMNRSNDKGFVRENATWLTPDAGINLKTVIPTRLLPVLTLVPTTMKVFGFHPVSGALSRSFANP
jgi:hypothetical protein